MDHTMRRSPLALALLIAPLVASPGCGQSGNTIRVSGKLLKGGAPYAPPKGQAVSVTLVGLEVQDKAGKTIPSSEPFWANFDPAGATFSVPGVAGRGIPPGKYRVAVTQKLTREAFDAAYPQPQRDVSREADTLADQFGPGTSPIVRELKTTGEELVIDLDHPAG